MEVLTFASTAFAGSVLGAAVSGPVSLVGLPLMFAGFHLKDKHPLIKYLVPIGAGMFLANGYKKQDGTVSGMDGLDLKSAQERVKNYFGNFSEKFSLPGAKPVNGLDGNEQVTYFINPYGQEMAATPELDTSALDRISAQIAEMNGPVNGGYPVGEINGNGPVGQIVENQGYPRYFNEMDPSEANF